MAYRRPFKVGKSRESECAHDARCLPGSEVYYSGVLAYNNVKFVLKTHLGTKRKRIVDHERKGDEQVMGDWKGKDKKQRVSKK